jgi:hypothetical protein
MEVASEVAPKRDRTETELLILWMYRILPGPFLERENEFQI